MKKYDYKELTEKLERCKNIDLKDVTLDDVDDIKNIKIDRRKSSEERILDFLIKTKNPYIFKVNGKLVRIRFSETSSLTVDDCLTNCLKSLYK